MAAAWSLSAPPSPGRSSRRSTTTGGWWPAAAGPSAWSPPPTRPAWSTGLVTGWHDPQASHLLLVEAVAGPTLTQQAYDAAVAGGYLWHEFGDAALLLP